MSGEQVTRWGKYLLKQCDPTHRPHIDRRPLGVDQARPAPGNEAVPRCIPASQHAPYLQRIGNSGYHYTQTSLRVETTRKDFWVGKHANRAPLQASEEAALPQRESVDNVAAAIVLHTVISLA